MKEQRGFLARVVKSGKVTIPINIRQLLDIKQGDLVDVTVRKTPTNSR